MSRPGARVISGALALLLGGSLSACGGGGGGKQASYDDFCNGYVQLIRSEMVKPVDATGIKKQAASMRDIGVPSDMSGSAQSGLDQLLKNLDGMQAGAKTIPSAGGDQGSMDFGAYLDAHCGDKLKQLYSEATLKKLGQTQAPPALLPTEGATSSGG